MRITQKMLQSKVDQLNELTGQPTKSWEKKDGKYTANIGNYHLCNDYGSTALHVMMNEGGGVEELYRGTKSEIFAYIKGMMQKKVG